MSRADRSRPPAPGPRKPCPFPAFEDRRLDNGLRLLMAPMRAFPIVSAEILLATGSQHNPPGQPGLSRLHGSLLTEGTEQRSGPELARAIEDLGGSLSSGAGWNLGWAEVNLLGAHVEAGLDLLAETTRSVAFHDDQVQRVRDVQAAHLLRRGNLPKSLAEDAFHRLLYAGTPYAEPLDGRADAVESFTRADVVDFHRRHVQPESSCLVAIGDFDPEWLHDRAQALWGDWSADGQSSVQDPTITPATLDTPRVVVVDRPGAAQTAFHLGHAGPPRRHPDFHTIMVLNVLFGGKFTSRLNLNLRERHGFTYGVQSQFARRRGPG
ncbi:MAG: pitrilysin family protein, partial [Acidobacteriota bacterium]